MKILILGPLNYESARQDLILMNYRQNVYSAYYAVEGLISQNFKRGVDVSNKTHLMIMSGLMFTQKEYEVCDIIFGLLPKTYDVDMVICYNPVELSTQEAFVASHTPDFYSTFYTTEDRTHTVPNIMEAIKLAQSEATRGN